MAEKSSFVLYTRYREQINMLNNEQAGQLMKAIFDYQAVGEVEIEDPVVAMLWSVMKQQLDADDQKYQEVCAKRKEAGSKGGRSKCKTEQANQANAIFAKQTEANQADNEIDNENDIDISSSSNDYEDIDNIKTSCAFSGEKVRSGVQDGALESEGGVFAVPKKDLQEQRFDEFWNTYPRKVGKEAARKAWKKIKPDAALFQKILHAVTETQKSEQWKKQNGQFIPHPATWLNQGRWDDVIDTSTTNATNTPYQQRPRVTQKFTPEGRDLSYLEI